MGKIAEKVHDKLKGIRRCSKCGKPLTSVSEWQISQVGQFFFRDGEFVSSNFPEEPDDIEVEVNHDGCGHQLSDEDYEWFLKKLKE